MHVDVNYLLKMPDKSAESAARLLKKLNKASPCNISKVLTDNGTEFTDRFDNNIEHRLTKPRHPQTNGMVERFNGRIPQKMIGHRTPLDALRQWQRERSELFVKKIYNLAKPDGYVSKWLLGQVGKRVAHHLLVSCEAVWKNG